MTFRHGFYTGLIVALIWGVYLARLWQADRQVELHTVHLLAKLEKKDWNAVGGFIGNGYQDRWGNDRALLLERLRDIFRLIPNGRIEVTSPSTRIEAGRGYCSARIRIRDAGPFGDFIEGRVNLVESPFEFGWQRGATWPWDWKLIMVRNPELEIPEALP